jgi:FkbM family methyltransferase
MRLPKRFGILPAYFANIVRPTISAPSFLQVLRFISQRGKIGRAGVFINSVSEAGPSYQEVRFHENPAFPLYYPKKYRWVDFCQTVDECFNPRNWHNFLSPQFDIGPKDVVIDCGAAEGLFTWLSAQRGAQVHAFEPEAGFVASMRKSFASIPHVSVNHCALGHRSGQAFLSEDEIFSRLTVANRGKPVEVRTLDDAFGQAKVTFLKADVEGYEFRVLLGAAAVIRRHQPRIAVTVYHPQNNVAEIADFLRECHPNYRFATKGIYDNGHPVLLQAWA